MSDLLAFLGGAASGAQMAFNRQWEAREAEKQRKHHKDTLQASITAGQEAATLAHTRAIELAEKEFDQRLAIEVMRSAAGVALSSLYGDDGLERLGKAIELEENSLSTTGQYVTNKENYEHMRNLYVSQLAAPKSKRPETSAALGILRSMMPEQHMGQLDKLEQSYNALPDVSMEPDETPSAGPMAPPDMTGGAGQAPAMPATTSAPAKPETAGEAITRELSSSNSRMAMFDDLDALAADTPQFLGYISAARGVALDIEEKQAEVDRMTQMITSDPNLSAYYGKKISELRSEIKSDTRDLSKNVAKIMDDVFSEKAKQEAAASKAEFDADKEQWDRTMDVARLEQESRRTDILEARLSFDINRPRGDTGGSGEISPAEERQRAQISQKQRDEVVKAVRAVKDGEVLKGKKGTELSDYARAGRVRADLLNRGLISEGDPEFNTLVRLEAPEAYLPIINKIIRKRVEEWRGKNGSTKTFGGLPRHYKEFFDAAQWEATAGFAKRPTGDVVYGRVKSKPKPKSKPAASKAPSAPPPADPGGMPDYIKRVGG